MIETHSPEEQGSAMNSRKRKEKISSGFVTPDSEEGSVKKRQCIRVCLLLNFFAVVLVFY